MKDEFNKRIDEEKKYNEFREFIAEKYEPLETIKIKSDVYSPDEIKLDGSQEKKKKKEKTGLKESDISKATRGNSITGAVTKVMSSVSTVVIGAAATVVIIATAVANPPIITEEYFDYGSNYLEYNLNVSELDDTLDYKIELSSGEELIFEDEVNEGDNETIIYDLVPSTEYLLSIIGYSSSFDEKAYYEKKFTTENPEYKKALFDVSISFHDVEFESSESYDMFDIQYQVYVSDVNKENQYYLRLKKDEETYDENQELIDSFFNGNFYLSDPGIYTLEVCTTEEVDPVVIGSYTIETIYPDDYYKYEEYNIQHKINDFTIDFSLAGKLKENEEFQMIITEINDGEEKEYTYHLDVSNSIYTSVNHQKNSLMSTFTYKVVLLNNTEIIKTIYESEVIEVPNQPSVVYNSITSTQNALDQEKFNAVITFDIDLTYYSYYVITDNNGFISEHLYTNIIEISDLAIGEHTFYYQIFDEYGKTITEQIPFVINIELNDNEYLYSEVSVIEDLNTITIDGTILGVLPNNNQYLITINENIQNTEGIFRSEILEVNNNSFNFVYQKDQLFNGFNYEIIIIDETEAIVKTLYTSEEFTRTLEPSIVLSKQTINKDMYDNSIINLILDFNTVLPYGSYYIVDDGTTSSEKLYTNSYTINSLTTTTYTYYYQLYDYLDNPIGEKQTINGDTTMPEYGDFYFTTPNPSSAQITYNDDHTFNLYLLTEFDNTSEQDIDYSVELYLNNSVAYTFRGKSKVAYFENIPINSYSIYYHTYVNVDNVAYEIECVNPSGSIIAEDYAISYYYSEPNLSFISNLLIKSDLTVTITYDDNSIEEKTVLLSDIDYASFSTTISNSNIKEVKVKGLFTVENANIETVRLYLNEIEKELKGNLIYEAEITCYQ